jgi:hypothetical protein
MSNRWIDGLCVVVVGALVAPQAWADDQAFRPRVRADAGLTFSRFEQQVKAEIGGARGERLVQSTELGLLLTGAYSLHALFEVGLFAQGDVGSRSAGRFVGFDANGAAQLDSETGGAYQELWLGPLIRGRYGPAFVELGWGALGLRWDEARDDLPSTTGETDGALVRNPAIAWLLAAGGAVPLGERLDLVLRLEYRVRYYTSRGGNPLAEEIAHGTQSFAPFIGVGYGFGEVPTSRAE